MTKEGKSHPRALHINSYFLSNSIHYNFYKEIKKIKDDKFLIPVYKHFRDKNIKGLDIDYIFTKFDSKFFFTKAIKVLYLVFKKGLTKDFDYIHAHTLFSDGFAAYILSYLLKKKLVVSVRDTDVRLFLPASKLFVWIGSKILKRAKAVFFISPSLKYAVKKRYPLIVDSNYYLLPNGLDKYWSENKKNVGKNLETKSHINLLFVGQIIPRKNLEILLDFIKVYSDRKYVLNIVGENFTSINFHVLNSELNNGNKINYLGKVSSKETLRGIYSENDIFVLLSRAETFGVVYVEAISQGLPIIYTKNQGIDGFYKEGEVGYSCEDNSLVDLKSKIDLIIANSVDIYNSQKNAVDKFSWGLIIENYLADIDRVF